MSITAETLHPMPDALAPRLLRRMMKVRGIFPFCVPRYEGNQEFWKKLDRIQADNELVQIRDHHCRRASDAFAGFVLNGRGAKAGVESAYYANVLQIVMNREANRPLLDCLPFPLPDGWLVEQPGLDEHTET
jgi:hypothetical protein